MILMHPSHHFVCSSLASPYVSSNPLTLVLLPDARPSEPVHHNDRGPTGEREGSPQENLKGSPEI